MCLLDKDFIGPFRNYGTPSWDCYKVLVRYRNKGGAIRYLSPIKQQEHMEVGKEYEAIAYDNDDDPVNHGFHAFVHKEGAEFFLETIRSSNRELGKEEMDLCICRVIIGDIFANGYTQVGYPETCFRVALTFVGKKMTIVGEVK